MGCLDSCNLKALPEYVNVSDESHVYIKHTCNCDKRSVGQWVVSAQLHTCRKAGEFWLLPGEIKAQLLKKVYLNQHLNSNSSIVAEA